MRIVTANELQDWLSQGELLEKDSHGPKVVRLPDGSLLKIFRSRRNPLLARLRPDARRFAERAERLQALGIATPDIRECAWIVSANGCSPARYLAIASAIAAFRVLRIAAAMRSAARRRAARRAAPRAAPVHAARAAWAPRAHAVAVAEDAGE